MSKRTSPGVGGGDHSAASRATTRMTGRRRAGGGIQRMMSGTTDTSGINCGLGTSITRGSAAAGSGAAGVAAEAGRSRSTDHRAEADVRRGPTPTHAIRARSVRRSEQRGRLVESVTPIPTVFRSGTWLASRTFDAVRTDFSPDTSASALWTLGQSLDDNFEYTQLIFLACFGIYFQLNFCLQSIPWVAAALLEQGGQSISPKIE